MIFLVNVSTLSLTLLFIGAHENMLPTLLAAAGDTRVKEDLLKGRKLGDRTYKVHLDGYNLLPALKGEEVSLHIRLPGGCGLTHHILAKQEP